MNLRSFWIIIFILSVTNVWSQVGINVEKPEATLHINAEQSDGLIIENLPKTSDLAHNIETEDPEYSNLQISKTGVVRVKENIKTYGNYILDPKYGDIELLAMLPGYSSAYILTEQMNIPVEQTKYLYWKDSQGNSVEKYITLPEDGAYYFYLDLKGPVYMDREYKEFPNPRQVTEEISVKIGNTYGKSDKHIVRIWMNDMNTQELYISPYSSTPPKNSGKFVKQAEGYSTISYLLEGKKGDKISFSVVYQSDISSGVENGGNNLAWTLRSNILNPNQGTSLYFYKIN